MTVHFLLLNIHMLKKYQLQVTTAHMQQNILTSVFIYVYFKRILNLLILIDFILFYLCATHLVGQLMNIKTRNIKK